MNIRTRKIARWNAFAIVGTLLVTGCTAQTAESAPTTSTIEVTDAWVKAADSGMSAAFGDIRNSGAADVTVVSAETEASTMLELHETIENDAGMMVMREVDGGFVIPAGESLTLEPGGDHLMLMDLTTPLVAGDEVTFTLTFSDASTAQFTAVVKDYSGANETYEDIDHDEHGSGEGH